MDILGISAALGLEQDLAKSTTQTSGEEFQNILSEALGSQDDAKLKEACNGLESYLMSMVFKQVKQSMLQDDEEALIPKGDYTKMFEEKMINAVADKLVENGGIGLSDQIYKQVKTSYEAQMNISKENEAIVGTTMAKVDQEA